VAVADLYYDLEQLLINSMKALVSNFKCAVWVVNIFWVTSGWLVAPMFSRPQEFIHLECLILCSYCRVSQNLA